MEKKLSKRLLDIVDALPIKPNSRILEIGCGPGAMARAIAAKLEQGHVLAIDRSAKAIDQAKLSCKKEIKSGKLSFIKSSAEDFKLKNGEPLYDFAVAIRVGALDGRHPDKEEKAKSQIRKALKKNGKLYIDDKNKIIKSIALNTKSTF